ncbi:MAG: hypothetical protein LBM06_04235 [Prevotellaceae bacterium]|nr:hypothetical protein [Prevotellaceae bacterium]
MIKLGHYTVGQAFAGLRQPAAPVDRLLEGAALLLLIATWVLALLLKSDEIGSIGTFFKQVGVQTTVMLALGASANLPAKSFRFPVRITQYNVRAQLFLAVRLVRVLNVVCGIIFLGMQLHLLPVVLGGTFLLIACGGGYIYLSRRYR